MTAPHNSYQPGERFREREQPPYKRPVTLDSIQVYKVLDRTDLRFDWSNDRHQAILLNGTDAESVKEGLLQAAHLLAKEIRAGYI